MEFKYYTKKETGFGYHLWIANTDEYVTIAKLDKKQYLVTNEATGSEEMFDNLKDAKSSAKLEVKSNNVAVNKDINFILG